MCCDWVLDMGQMRLKCNPTEALAQGAVCLQNQSSVWHHVPEG